MTDETITDQKLAKLQALCEAATPGPWLIDKTYQYWGDKIRGRDGRIIGGAYSSQSNWLNDVVFMATLNPLLVAALIKRVRELEAGYARIHGINDNPSCYKQEIDAVIDSVIGAFDPALGRRILKGEQPC